MKESKIAKPTGGEHDVDIPAKKHDLVEGMKTMLRYGFVDMVVQD